MDLVVDHAEGNPFYLEELVTWLIDAGVVGRGEPSWTVARDRIGAGPGLLGQRPGADEPTA